MNAELAGTRTTSVEVSSLGPTLGAIRLCANATCNNVLSATTSRKTCKSCRIQTLERSIKSKPKPKGIVQTVITSDPPTLGVLALQGTTSHAVDPRTRVYSTQWMQQSQLRPASTIVPHFTPQGDIISGLERSALPPRPRPAPAPPPPPAPPAGARVCLRFGCGTVLPPRAISALCARCIQLAATGRAPPRSPDTPGAPPPLSAPGAAPTADAASISLYSPTGSPPPIALSGRAPGLPGRIETAGCAIMGPPRPVVRRASDVPAPAPTSGVSRAKRAVRVCETPGCGGAVQRGSASPRCFSCTLKKWKTRVQEVSAEQSAQVTSSAAGPSKEHVTSSVATLSGSGAVSGVTDSDVGMATANIADHTLTISPNEASTGHGTLGASDTDSIMVDAPTLKSSVVNHDGASAQPGSEVSMDTAALALDTSRSTLGPASPRGTRQPPSSIEFSPGHRDPTASSGIDDDLHGVIGNVSMSGWDSDLTDLSDISDNSESDSGEPARRVPQHSSPTGLKIRIRIPPHMRVGAPGRPCAIRACKNHLPPSHPYKLCDPCRTHHREYQRQRLGCVPRPVTSALAFTSATRITIPAPPIPPPHAPPPEEYKWKMCPSCRVRGRERARKRRIAARGGVVESAADGPAGMADGLEDDLSCESEEGVEDAGLDESINAQPGGQTLGTESANPGKGKSRVCVNADCSFSVAAQSDSVECKRCLKDEGKGTTADDTKANHDSPERSKHDKSKPSRPQGDISPAHHYPRYQHPDVLLAAFHARLAGFLQAHAYYLRFAQAGGTAREGPALFVFNGEVSLVAADFDLVRRRRALLARIRGIRAAVAGAGTLQLSSAGENCMLRRDGMVARFQCVHEVVETEPAYRLAGELEVAVFADHSHVAFPGERIVVRFRLVG